MTQKQGYQHRWTPTQIHLLKECFMRGLTKKETATKIGLSEEQVRGKLLHLGLKRYSVERIPYSTKEDDMIIKYRNKDYTCQDIANKLCRTYSSVHNRIVKLIKDGRISKKI